MKALDGQLQSARSAAGHEIRAKDTGQLLKQPHPMSGESWVGYLLRLSAENQFPSLSVIAGVCGYTYMSKLLRQDPRDVLGRLGMPVPDGSEWVPHCMPRPFSHRKSRQGYVSQQWKTRLCPQCLSADAEHPYLRSHWDWSMQIHCPAHKVQLLEQCRRCKTPIDMRRKQLTHCNCGADFRQQQTPGSEGATNAITRLLPEIELNKLGKTFEREPDVHGEAVRVCQWLALPVEADGKRPKRKSRRNVSLSSDDLDRLQELVENWPNALAISIAPEVDLNSLASRTALATRLFRKRFGLFELATKKIQSIVHGAISRDASQSEACRTYSLSHRSHILAFSQLTGYAPRLLNRQIALGAIAPGILKCGDLVDPDRLEIDAHTLTLTTNFYAKTLDLDSAAVKAGCSKNAIRGLVQTECIPTGSICNDKSKLTFRRINPSALQDFASDLFSLARCEAEQVAGGIKFSDWVTRHAHGRVNRHLRWRDILSSIRAGKLTLYKSVEVPDELDQLLLCAEDLANVCDKRRSSHQCFL